jgi:hypothetical protein
MRCHGFERRFSFSFFQNCLVNQRLCILVVLVLDEDLLDIGSRHTEILVHDIKKCFVPATRRPTQTYCSYGDHPELRPPVSVHDSSSLKDAVSEIPAVLASDRVKSRRFLYFFRDCFLYFLQPIVGML